MPPMYPFRCSRSGLIIDVQRDVDDRDLPPTQEEIEAAKLGPPPGAEGADPQGSGGWAWVRYIPVPKVAFGEGWSFDGRGLKGRH